LVDEPRPESHLEVADLAAGYKNVAIIRAVSMAVGLGEVVTVIGPNGAGKSTLMKAITGMLTPMHGEVSLAGESIGGLSADRVARKGVGYVPQVRDVFDTLTVKENLEMGAYLLPRREVPDRITEVVEAFPQLKTMLGRTARNLSGGERKMLAIGRVLMNRPALVILDEPTAGLAPKVASQLLEDYVVGLRARRIAVLVVEQRAREALAIADFAYVMASGEVKMATQASRILERPDIGEVFMGRGLSTPAWDGAGKA
jgi:ABC-type branched-subunit amino acid transport system ATPase component